MFVYSCRSQAAVRGACFHYHCPRGSRARLAEVGFELQGPTLHQSDREGSVVSDPGFEFPPWQNQAVQQLLPYCTALTQAALFFDSRNHQQNCSDATPSSFPSAVAFDGPSKFNVQLSIDKLEALPSVSQVGGMLMTSP